MLLDLVFPTVPDKVALDSLERWLSCISSRQEYLDGARILWISSVPGTQYRPFAESQPFQLRVYSPVFSHAECDAFQIALGCVPKKWLTFGCDGDSLSHVRILLEVCIEITKICRCLVCFQEGFPEVLGRILLSGRSGGLPCIEQLPGWSYEVAREASDGELVVMDLLDARCLKHWYSFFRPQSLGCDNHSTPYAARAASLDY